MISNVISYGVVIDIRMNLRLPLYYLVIERISKFRQWSLSQRSKKKKARTKETRVHQRNTRAKEQTREIELPSKEIEKKGFALVCVSLNFSCVPVKIPRSCMSV